MNKELYELFKQLQTRGSRSEAGAAMNQFVQSFASIDEKRVFTHWFFRNDFDGKRIWHELYEMVLFPVLIEGYKKADPWSVKQLAETDENLYQAKPLWEQLGYKPRLALLREYVTLRPHDYTARRRLLAEEINAFHYCDQNWPATILYGAKEATETECEKLLKEVAYARELDVEQKYATYIGEFETKVNSYRKRFRK